MNVGPEEMRLYKKSYKKCKLISFSGLGKAEKNSAIIIEDIIHMEKKDEKNMRVALNYDAHHKSQKIFSISHAIHKTSIWSMLSFFHFIIFTSSASNVPVLRFTLNYFKIDKEVVDSWIDRFKKLGRGKKNYHFYFNCTEMKFYFTKDILKPTESLLIGSLGGEDSGENFLENSELLKKNLQTKFEKFLEGHPTRLQASAVFSIIVNSLDLNLIREHDLTVCFNSFEGNKLTRISLIDYITCILTPLDPTPKTLIVLHKYIKTFCFIPLIFVKNSNFKNV